MNVCAGSWHQRLEQIANQSENGTEPRDSADEANDGQTFKDVLTDTLSLGGRGQGEGKSAIIVRISPTSNHTRGGGIKVMRNRLTAGPRLLSRSKLRTSLRPRSPRVLNEPTEPLYPNFTPLFGGWVNFEFHRKAPSPQ